MSEEKRDTVEILRSEQKFLEDGGYGRSPHAPWRAPYIFEDSPSCLNFNDSSRTHACGECVLMQFVPPELRAEPAPCRFIPLNDKGQTVESLYRSGTQIEMEDALGEWLRREINRIETEQMQEK